MNGTNFGGTILMEEANAKAMEMLGGMFSFYLVFALAYMLYNAYVLYRIAERAGIEKKWLAFIPGGGFFIRMKITETYSVMKVLLGIIGFFVVLMVMSIKSYETVAMLYIVLLFVVLTVMSFYNILMDFRLYEYFEKPGFLAFAFLLGIGVPVKLIMYSIIAFEKK